MTNDMQWLGRTELLLGVENLAKLQNSNVLIVGLGGVGAYSAELIARAGVGKMTIVDGDRINDTNRNRQLPALVSTVGMEKSTVLGARLLDINPALQLTIIHEYVKEDRFELLVNQGFDYVVDAIDTLSPKFQLVLACLKNNIKLISSMGAGGKLDPSKVEIAEIEKSYNCKLAYRIRKKMHQIGYQKGFKVVFSSEIVEKNVRILTDDEPNKRTTVGTISYMPPIFGCYIASVVVREIINKPSSSKD